MSLIAIKDENDLFAALQTVKETGLGPEATIEFMGWPNFEVIIRGENFDGGVPTRIMPSLLDLQRNVYAAYSNLKYGHQQKLTYEERRQAELVVHFQSGHSTKFLAPLWPILNNMAKQAVGKMNGPQAVIVILGIAAMTAGTIAWKSNLNTRMEEKGMDHALEMSREETKRQELMANIAGNSPALQEVIRQNRSFQENLLKRLAPDDQLVIDGNPVINGRTAQFAIRKARAEPVESRLDADFIIISVESGLVRGGFRLKVRDVTTKDELTVKVPEGTLNSEQIKTLQSGEWEKKPLNMKMNVKKVNDRITEATLIEAGLT